jgi:ABC-2 type transport system ATP-binding protein
MEIVRLAHLQRRYGELLAFSCDEVSLSSGVVGLLGPNGAGKSTLVQVLMGLLEPSSGRAFVLGLDASRRGVDVRARVGYVPEHDAFVSGLSGIDQVALAGELSGLARRKALRRAHEVLDFVGLEEQRYRRLDEYSTGMKQRVKVAQALVHGPELLILDEPTNGLDPSGRRAMLALISRLHREEGLSVLLSSHILDDVERVSDSVLILDRGRVLAHGRVDLLRRPRPNRFRLRLSGDPRRFYALIEERGGHVAPVETASFETKRSGETEAIVELPRGRGTRDIFAALAESVRPAAGAALDGALPEGVVLRELLPDEEGLGEIFARVLGDGGREPEPEAPAADAASGRAPVAAWERP